MMNSTNTTKTSSDNTGTTTSFSCSNWCIPTGISTVFVCISVVVVLVCSVVKSWKKKSVKTTTTAADAEDTSECDALLVSHKSTHNVQYVNNIDSAVFNDVRLDDIVDVALNFKINSYSNAIEMFSLYCANLGPTFGSSEPYGKTMRIEVSEKISTVNELIENLPDNETALKSSIINAIMKLEFRTKNQAKNKTVSDFFTILVSKCGDNIEIKPCYMSITKVFEYERSVHSNVRRQYHEVQYRHQKFVLSKFDIEMICNNIRTYKQENKYNRGCISEASSSSNHID